MPVNKLTVYYDGSCRVCSREMLYYSKRDRNNVLEFVDIAEVEFNAQRHGRLREAFMARLHVRDSQGEFSTGVDAFAAIWRQLPGWHLDVLANMVQAPGIHLLATFGYEIFARLRPWLPKQVAGCDSESCRWGHPYPRA